MIGVKFKVQDLTPRHVAIIMDGNGRWAKGHRLPRVAGHQAGAESVKKIIRVCAEKGIEVLTLFAFGVDNWQRPPSEVKQLMKLFLKSLDRDSPDLHKNNIRFRVMGDLSRFNKKLRERIQRSEELMANNTGMQLVIAANYSGRWDLVEATRKLAEQVSQGELLPANIDERCLETALSTYGLPEPDLFIRTSGEQRISNFMLWQFAYTEFYFTETLWPDFGKDELNQALDAYAGRVRRFGMTDDQLQGDGAE